MLWKLLEKGIFKKSSALDLSKEKIAKECSKYHTVALISHASKVMLKILQARLQQYVNRELPDVQAGLRNGRGTRDQIANICWIIEKAREFQKNIYFCFIDLPKPLTVWITGNCGKFLKRWEYQITLPASWEICMQVKKQQLVPDIEQWNWFQIGKEVHQCCILSSCLFILYTEYIVQNPCQTGLKHKMKSRSQGDISITSDMQMTPPL